jgi:beta-galactosidase beta subunit
LWWDKAFAFMKNADLVNFKPGDYSIDGDNVYERITEVPLKNIDSSKSRCPLGCTLYMSRIDFLNSSN